MRSSIAALAVIRRRHAGNELWLAQWNAHWRAYHLVGGHKRAEESFRQCVVREMAEELGLAASDYLVADAPLTHLDYSAWSVRAEQLTAYTVELFAVELTDEAIPRIAADPRNRWLREDEILAGRCDDDQPVSETMRRLLFPESSKR